MTNTADIALIGSIILKRITLIISGQRLKNSFMVMVKCCNFNRWDID